MARKIKKRIKNYPKGLVFNENLEGVGQAFDLAGLNLPDVYVAIKGASDHLLAQDLEEAVFFTCDQDWLSRQPPYDHGGMVVLDVGNLSMEEKAFIIRNFLFAFHIRNKSLDTLKRKRYRLTKTRLWEVPIEGEPRRIWELW